MRIFYLITTPEHSCTGWGLNGKLNFMKQMLLSVPTLPAKK